MASKMQIVKPTPNINTKLESSHSVKTTVRTQLIKKTQTSITESSTRFSHCIMGESAGRVSVRESLSLVRRAESIDTTFQRIVRLIHALGIADLRTGA